MHRYYQVHLTTLSKGKVERAIGYVRQSFWPLRTFADLSDVNAQAHQWVEHIANQRKHRETGQAPNERFQPEFLRPLPLLAPDYRDSAEALVHKDLRLCFDGNRYCVPPRYAGRNYRESGFRRRDHLRPIHEIVSYARCWERGRTFGAERFQKELFAQLAAAQRSAAQQRLMQILGPTSEYYLRKLAETDRSLTRQVRELLELVRDYGPEAVGAALEKAYEARAFRADYIANILRQQQTRRDVQPPLRLKHPELNELVHRSTLIGGIRRLHSAIPKGSSMTSLQQKLNQLSLTTMSRQLDQMIADAATKNLGFAQALETLADLELDSRNNRAIERRFRMSRLHAQHSIDSFHFKHHKSRMESKNRIVRLLDLEFIHKGTSVVLIGNPGMGKTFLAKIIGWRACQANQRVLFTTAMDMLNHLHASQVDHSLVRKLRVYTEPTLW